MNRNSKKILKSSHLEWCVSRFFEISHLINLVEYQLLDQNLYGNLLKSMIAWDTLESCRKGTFSDGINVSTQCNLAGKEWKSLENFAADKSAVIKSFDKLPSVVVWERNYYLHATKLLENYGLLMMLLNLTKIFSLVEKSNKAFKGLCSSFIMSLIIFILIEPTVCETSTEIVNFIDLNILIKNGAIITDLYVKPIYGH